MSYKGSDYEPVYRWGYYAAIACIVLMVAVFQPFAKPEPVNSRAYGCYTAAGAPSIRLDNNGMAIMQKSFPVIKFHLERHKTGITLTADAPIQADANGGSYVYSMYHPGIGSFLNFYRDDAGHRYDVFDETQLTSFIMLARDGNEISYVKAGAGDCVTRES